MKWVGLSGKKCPVTFPGFMLESRRKGLFDLVAAVAFALEIYRIKPSMRSGMARPFAPFVQKRSEAIRSPS